MKAVILTGGLGTRLAPYTTVLPKPLMPIGNIPILQIILKQLKHFGFSDVILACGFLAELIQAYFMKNGISRELNIGYHLEDKPLGTAGALEGVKNLTEPFLVMNGDVLTTMDYSKLVEYHKSRGAALTIAVTQKQVKIDLGVLFLDENNQVTGYDEKPVKQYPASMGIYVYEPRVLKYIQPNAYLDVPTLVLRLIEAGEKVAGYVSEAFWLDIGNAEDYERAVNEFEQNRSRFHVD
ncbi:MAG: NDP-sugar synthase [Nitrospinales bacterium]